jgi:hypothetical protein
LSWLGRGSGPDDSPRLGTLLTLGIALAAVSLGNINLIAPILTMFFLTTYGVLNVVASIEDFLSSPSYRPTFKVHWSLSLLGALGCIAVMLLISALSTLIAVIVVIGVYWWLKRRELQVTWGDVRQGLWLNLARVGLLNLRETMDAKNWQPHLLVFSGVPRKRWYLVEFAAELTHNSALLSIATLLTDDRAGPERQLQLENTLREYLAQRGIQAFLRVARGDDFFEGAKRMIDVYGLGALTPNTIVLGDTENPQHHQAFAQLLLHSYRSERNSIVMRYDHERGFAKRQRIDVWWSGLKGNGGFMLTLAYLLQSSREWRGSQVTVKMMVSQQDAAQDAKNNIDALIKNIRIKAEVAIIISQGRSFEDILGSSSQEADLVLLGMRRPSLDEADDYASYLQSLRERTQSLSTTAFVLAAESAVFSGVLGND